MPNAAQPVEPDGTRQDGASELRVAPSTAAHAASPLTHEGAAPAFDVAAEETRRLILEWVEDHCL